MTTQNEHHSSLIKFHTVILENMGTAIICTDANMNIVYLNNASEKLILKSKHNILGYSILDFFLDEINLSTLSRRSLAENQKFNISNTSFILNNKSTCSNTVLMNMDSKILVDVSVTPLTLATTEKTNKPLQNSILIFELHKKGQQTEIFEQESQREQHDIIRILVRKIAHEIKNPLASIRGVAQLMQMTIQDLALPKSSRLEFKKYTELMIKESDRLKNLTNAMLGSNELMNQKISNIHEPIEHVLTLVNSQFSSIKLQRDYDVSLPDIHIDKDRMIQVFLNIALNAAESLTRTRNLKNNFKPTIIFKTRVTNHRVILGVAYRNALEISIIDNGNGIPNSMLKTLFYPMISTKKNGNGLGLSIAQEVIKHHQGEINCESDLGNTTFRILLPCTE